MGSYISYLLPYSENNNNSVNNEESQDVQNYQISIYESQLPTISISDSVDIMKLSFLMLQGIAVNRDGVIYFQDSDGNWIPTCRLTN